MADETEGTAAEATGGLDPLQQTLLEVLLRGGKGGSEALMDLVSRATLTSEQQSMLHLFRAAQSEWASAEEEPEEDARSREEEVGEGEWRSRADVEEMRGELADLREVNDTLAAALGACALCWGGDPGCALCRGRGGPGFALPDPRLFNELVVPAFRRAYRWQWGNGAARTGRVSRFSHDPRRQP